MSSQNALKGDESLALATADVVVAFTCYYCYPCVVASTAAAAVIAAILVLLPPPLLLLLTACVVVTVQNSCYRTHNIRG